MSQRKNLPLPVLMLWLALMIIREAAADEPVPLSDRIDQVVAAGYHGPEIPPVGDLEFLRRVYLDLIGRGPMVEEVRAFLGQLEQRREDSQAVRRDVIDDLLERDEFSRQYARVFDVMLTERREKISTLEFREFLRQWLAEKKPLNELCLEILAADGTGEKWKPAASFFVNRDAEPNLMTRDVGRIFFGRDVQCAQCHDHPLVTDYEQSEFFGILSFVHRTYLFNDEKRGNRPLLGEKADGQLEFASVFHPERGKSTAQPMLPMVMAMDTEPVFVSEAEAYLVAPEKDRRGIPYYSRRQQLAVLATHPENQSFNRNLANRLWANLMGTGIVHPVDMHHAGNPPVSAALLRLLADELVACRYDLREMLRQMTRSQTYQRSLIDPKIEAWEGPPRGIPGLDMELQSIEDQLAELKPRYNLLNGEIKEATAALDRYQSDVNRVQQQIDEEKTVLQKDTTDRDSAAARLTEMQDRLKKARELATSLTAALGESDKAVSLQPDDRELVAARDLLKARLGTANEAAKKNEEEHNAQQEALTDAENRVGDQKGRVMALSNRRLALGEFVVEARGILRRVRNRQQALLDKQSDYEQARDRIHVLKNWLGLRDQIRQSAAAGQNEQAAEQRKQLELFQTELLELWRRSYALRSVRGLSPEQLAGATYTAIEMYRPVREKAMFDWTATHQENPVERDDVRKRQQFVSAALAANRWDTVEDLIVERFSAPAGTPQDGFFATIDQALAIQNDPAFQNWLKPSSGNLTERLIALEDAGQLADELYLSTLCRLPDDEERNMIRELLKPDTVQRATLVQELIWGVLASAEFRFFP
ncbi:MAG: DUF1553 domain-containing protein [Planctomycetota bacterium]